MQTSWKFHCSCTAHFRVFKRPIICPFLFLFMIWIDKQITELQSILKLDFFFINQVFSAHNCRYLSWIKMAKVVFSFYKQFI